MVVRRQWKIVSGGVVAAVTLGGGAALAHSSGSAPEVPQLKDVVNVEQIGLSQSFTDTTGFSESQLQVGAADESPFSALTASQESDSEPTLSEPSDPSQSEPSDSEPSDSEPSQSEPSESEDSISADSDD
jgi:hypothetical protein